MTGVEVGAISAMQAGAGVLRGEKITHVPTFPCVSQIQDTVKAQNAHPRMLSLRAVQDTGGLKLVFGDGNCGLVMEPGWLQGWAQCSRLEMEIVIWSWNLGGFRVGVLL